MLRKCQFLMGNWNCFFLLTLNKSPCFIEEFLHQLRILGSVLNLSCSWFFSHDWLALFSHNVRSQQNENVEIFYGRKYLIGSVKLGRIGHYEVKVAKINLVWVFTQKVVRKKICNEALSFEIYQEYIYTNIVQACQSYSSLGRGERKQL